MATKVCEYTWLLNGFSQISLAQLFKNDAEDGKRTEETANRCIANKCLLGKKALKINEKS